VVTIEGTSDRRGRKAPIGPLALHDARVGLPNRVQFHGSPNAKLASIDDGQSQVMASVDLYPFKEISRSLGRANGDRLLRWARPRLRYYSTAAFIPFAEEASEIIPRSEWLLRVACSEAAGRASDSVLR